MALIDILEAFWKLDEASGDAVDAHGSNTLTDNNTVGSGTGLVYAGARDFEEGSSEAFSIADNAALSFGNEDFAVAAWVNLESKPSHPGDIVAKGTNSGTGEYYLSYRHTSDRFDWEVYGAPGFTSWQTVSANNFGSPPTSTWCFVIAWHDSVANTINIQVNDGTVDSAAHTAGCHDAAGKFSIGGGYPHTTLGEFFDGLIGPAMVFRGIPDATERTWLFNSGAGRTLAEIVATGGGTAYSLTAAQGSVALSGQTAALKAGRKIAAGQGSFVQAGQTAILKTGRQIVSVQGSFTQSGQNAGLNVARKVAAGQASFALTGQTAALLRSYLLASGVGAFTENGQNVGFPISRKVAAQQASFALDGQTAAFVVNRLLSAVNGSFALAGQSVVFNSARTMTAAQGIFTLTGQIAALLKGKRLSVDAGTFAVSGQNASFQSARRLDAANGALSLSGQDAGLKRSLMITCNNGVYSVNGQTATMYRARSMPAEGVFLAATGQTVAMRRSVNLAAGYGAFALTGQTVQLRASTEYVFQHPVYVTVGSGEAFASVSSGENRAVVSNGETFVTLEV